MRDGYVKIASFDDLILAQVAKSKLEAEGIETWMANENMIRMDIFFSRALGGVQLWVKHEEAVRAMESLKEVVPIAETDLPKEAPPRAEALVCPECSSSNVSGRKLPTKTTIISFFLGLPLPFFRRRFYCFECGHHWASKRK